MPVLSADRDAILEQLKQAEDAAGRLLGGKSREQADWQPNQGASWGMWQCFDHLARINRGYCQTLEAAVENPRATGEGTRKGWCPGCLRDGSSKAWSHPCFKNPFVPLLRFTVGTGLMVIRSDTLYGVRALN